MVPLILLERRRRENLLLVQNRVNNRANFNSFDLSDSRFTELYRLNKALARNLIERLRPHINSSELRRGIKLEEKVLCTLRFCAVGSYQRCVGEDYNLSMSQTSVHRCIHEVIETIVQVLGHEFVSFPQTRVERNRIKQRFMENFAFPGTIGAVDCTHIAILKPLEDEHNFMNRKGNI